MFFLYAGHGEGGILCFIVLHAILCWVLVGATYHMAKGCRVAYDYTDSDASQRRAQISIAARREILRQVRDTLVAIRWKDHFTVPGSPTTVRYMRRPVIDWK